MEISKKIDDLYQKIIQRNPEKKEYLDKLKIRKITEELLHFILQEFQVDIGYLSSQSEFYEYDTMEIIIGQIKNDHKVGDIENTGITNKKDIELLYDLIKFMKKRMFANYNDIINLLYDPSIPLQKFIDKNYQYYSDYCMNFGEKEERKKIFDQSLSILNDSIEQWKEKNMLNEPVEMQTYIQEIIRQRTSIYKNNTLFNNPVYIITHRFLLNDFDTQIIENNLYNDEKMNFIYLFVMGMTQVLNNKNNTSNTGKVIFNFYSGLLHNRFDRLYREYQKQFMYRILDQIKIFSCYYFNQLMIFSADTGGGKSTQVPRMIMYYNYLLEIYKKIKNPVPIEKCTVVSRVACSQPTLKALQSILRIRSAVNVDYENFKGTWGDFENNDPVLSNFTTFKKVTNKNLLFNPILSRRRGYQDIPEQYGLCFYTDGKLLSDFQNKFVLSNNIIPESEIQQQMNHLQELDFIGHLEYKKNNQSITCRPFYDILIVDEAHKKNLNIELIISSMKLYTQLNRNLKIMILSATIDEDEDAFNRFFSQINRIRVHETFQRMKPSLLRRTETYLERPLYNFNEAKKLGVNKALQIAKVIESIGEYYQRKEKAEQSTQYGTQQQIQFVKNAQYEDENPRQQDLLFFIHSVKGVDELVDFFNQNIRNDQFIALPIYRGVHQLITQIIDDKKRIKLLDCSKKQLRYFLDGRPYDKVATDYKYIFYIATPIVEESVTIIELRYVIDLAYQQLVYKKFQSTKLERTMINMQSKIQRLGRLSRIPGAKGDYFGMYHPNQIKKSINAGLGNLDPIQVMKSYISLNKAYIMDFLLYHKMFVKDQNMNPLNIMYDYVIRNHQQGLISKIQDFDFSQLIQYKIFHIYDVLFPLQNKEKEQNKESVIEQTKNELRKQKFVKYCHSQGIKEDKDIFNHYIFYQNILKNDQQKEMRELFRKYQKKYKEMIKFNETLFEYYYQMRKLGHDDTNIILLLYLLREEEEIVLPDQFYNIRDPERQFKYLYIYAQKYYEGVKKVLVKLGINDIRNIDDPDSENAELFKQKIKELSQNQTGRIQFVLQLEIMQQTMQKVPLYDKIDIKLIDIFQYFAVNGVAQIYLFDFNINDVYIVIPQYTNDGKIMYRKDSKYTINGDGIKQGKKYQMTDQYGRIKHSKLYLIFHLAFNEISMTDNNGNTIIKQAIMYLYCQEIQINSMIYQVQLI